MLRRFRQFIKKHALIDPESKLLVAVSGGIDSSVLTNLLIKSGYQLTIAHCNFQLRGDDSNADEKLVYNLAENHKIPFLVKNFDTGKFAAENQISMQMAARDLRYAWFEQLRMEKKLDYLVTAHHANDQVETILFNLAKGTGIAGLRGIKPKNGAIIRPLLFASKDEIRNYAKENNLVWREDRSNESLKYHRNRIRQQVVPALQKINPGLEKSITQNVNRLGALEKLLKYQSKQIIQQYMKETPTGFALSMEWYQEDHGGFALLEEVLKPYGFNLEQCLNLQGAFNEPGRRFSTDRYEINVDRKQLLINRLGEIEPGPWRIEKADLSCSVDGRLFEMKSMPNAHFVLQTDSIFAQLDYDKITFPVTVRRWQAGDRFVPLGMNQQKKLSDFMIDAKIPVNLKKRLLVFESDGQIFWIAGQRIDERFKISDKTKMVLVIKMNT